MAEGGGLREFDVKEIIAKLENDKQSPSVRAYAVFNILAQHGVTNYDALCFAIEYIASLSGQMPWLTDAAKDLVRKLYIMHSVRKEDLEWLDSTTLQDSRQESTHSHGTSEPSSNSSTTPSSSKTT